jgi:hypothetical protein
MPSFSGPSRTNGKNSQELDAFFLDFRLGNILPFLTYSPFGLSVSHFSAGITPWVVGGRIALVGDNAELGSHGSCFETLLFDRSVFFWSNWNSA